VQLLHCLNLYLACFISYSKVIQYLLGDSTVEGSEGTNELVLSKLREAFSRAQKDSNVRLQETVLLTIAQLGRSVIVRSLYCKLIFRDVNFGVLVCHFYNSDKIIKYSLSEVILFYPLSLWIS
jgi:hypothetical protein